MDAMTRLMAALEQLRRYCDDFFQAACSKYPQHILCAPGCCRCCTIESVTLLEAHAIEEFIMAQGIETDSGNSGSCVFLAEGGCTIYPVRPIICRTHGLLLYNPEDGSVKRTCTMNFCDEGRGSINRFCAIDEVKISENMIRLNMAFMMIHGMEPGSHGRVALKELALRIRGA